LDGWSGWRASARNQQKIKVIRKVQLLDLSEGVREEKRERKGKTKFPLSNPLRRGKTYFILGRERDGFSSYFSPMDLQGYPHPKPHIYLYPAQ
jgi:hypothetical protein